MAESLKKLLSESGVTLKKAYGQNFLTDITLLDKIAEIPGAKKTDGVLEIGCGAGALTAALSAKAGKVVGYEIDERLKPVLSRALSGADNVTLVFKDIMKESMESVERRMGGEYFLCANLPYYITTPIIMRFLEEAVFLRSMTVMVQQEVAERLAAKPATPEYGAITVGVNLRGSAKIMLNVPKEKFTPVPKVDSAVVKIEIEKNKFAGADLKEVRNVVRAGFSSRRKTLENNLINIFKLPREKAAQAIERAGLKKGCRGETLSAEDYVKLTEAIKNVREDR